MVTLALGPDWGPFEGYRSTGLEEGRCLLYCRQTDRQTHCLPLFKQLLYLLLTDLWETCAMSSGFRQVTFLQIICDTVINITKFCFKNQLIDISGTQHKENT